jgi:Zn-dependent peptidase ImmA (M78 family)
VLSLDRMEIEEAGPNPERLAAAIHTQLNLKVGSIPVYEIAQALDIVDIRERPLIGLEGALVTTPDRNVGLIAINRKSRQERRRFTLAHELGHFLNLWHQPMDWTGGFACSRSDLGLGWSNRATKVSRHVDQEIQANRFAIELLAPARLVRPFLFGVPDLEKVVTMAEALGISREAAARRYAESRRDPTALVFASEGVVRYVQRHSDFPFVSCRAGARLFDLPDPIEGDKISPHVEADPREWLARPAGESLVVQTLRQKGGYSITLLILEDSGGHAEDR